MRFAVICMLSALAFAALAADRPGSAHGGRRVALVVGNDAYRTLPGLRKGRADARAVAAMLKRAGFDVSLELDLDQRGFKSALRAFKASLAGGDDAVFFYAGHGVEVGGSNYLLPIDAEQGENEDQLRDDSIRLQRVLDDLRDQKVRFSLVIVDACRDNPFRSFSRAAPGRGLAPTAPATGQMVIYSAGAGQSALDDLGDRDGDPNGLFTRVLLKEIRKGGVPADRIARRVRDEVARLAETVKHEQVPALYDQTRGEFYFFATSQAAAAGEGAAAAEVRSPESIEDELWALIEGSSDAADFEDYRRRYPNGRYAAIADHKIKALKRPATEPVADAKPSANAAPRPSTGAGGAPAVTGRVFRDCAECPEMVVVGTGSYVMGSREAEEGHWQAEAPSHGVSVRRTFALSRFTVTFDQWEQCVQDGACGGYRPQDNGWGRGARPVTNVSWLDAQAYVTWLAKRTGRPYRLPSEAEWEYAARAGTATSRYWGDAPKPGVANCADCGSPWDAKQTSPAGSFAPNGFGLYDMLGNVWQWTQDCWNYTYAGAPVDGGAMASGHCELRSTRGGSYLNRSDSLRAAARSPSRSAERRPYIGFRVARGLP